MNGTRPNFALRFLLGTWRFVSATWEAYWVYLWYYFWFAVVWLILQYPITMTVASLIQGDLVTYGPLYQKVFYVVNWIGYAPVYLMLYVPWWIVHLFVDVSLERMWLSILGVVLVPFTLASMLQVFVFLPAGILLSIFDRKK
jgi:hypothetical protein